MRQLNIPLDYFFADMPTLGMFHLGHAIEQLRKERNYKQVEVARKARISQGLLSAIEKGPAEGTSVRTLRRIAFGLKVRIADIFLKLDEMNGGRQTRIEPSPAAALECGDEEHLRLTRLLDEILHDEHWGPMIRGNVIALHRATRDGVKPTLRKAPERKVS